MANLRSYSTEGWDGLCATLLPGQYQLYTHLDHVPQPLMKFTGLASETAGTSDRPSVSTGAWRATLAMRMDHSTEPFTIGGVTVAPEKTVFRVRNFRQDEDASGAHQNVDDNLIFVDSNRSEVLRLPYREEEHFQRMSRQTSMDGFLGVYGLDGLPPTGTVDSLRVRGALSRFSTGG